MKWGRIVLIFQALVTFTIGMVFLSQVIALDLAKVAEFNMEIGTRITSSGEEVPKVIDIKQRYSSAAYILLFISISELIIIIKIFLRSGQPFFTGKDTSNKFIIS